MTLDDITIEFESPLGLNGMRHLLSYLAFKTHFRIDFFPCSHETFEYSETREGVNIFKRALEVKEVVVSKSPAVKGVQVILKPEMDGSNFIHLNYELPIGATQISQEEREVIDKLRIHTQKYFQERPE